MQNLLQFCDEIISLRRTFNIKLCYWCHDDNSGCYLLKYLQQTSKLHRAETHVKVVFVTQKKPFASYETQGLILHSQELVTSPDAEPDESISQTVLLLFSIMLNVIVYL